MATVYSQNLSKFLECINKSEFEEAKKLLHHAKAEFEYVYARVNIEKRQRLKKIDECIEHVKRGDQMKYAYRKCVLASTAFIEVIQPFWEEEERMQVCSALVSIVKRKSFKLWNHDKSSGRVIRAGTLKELKEKAKTKFKLDSTIRIVMEDGCEVDDDEGLKGVPEMTSLYILREDEPLSLPSTSAIPQPQDRLQTIMDSKGPKRRKHKTSNSKVSYSMMSSKCCICYERDKESFFIPCGHTICTVCGVTLESSGNPLCPFCRGAIQGIGNLRN